MSFDFLTERPADLDTPLRKDTEMPFRDKTTDQPLKGIRPNIVQSIRAFRVQELQDAATQLGQHFLYANLGNAQSKQDILDILEATNLRRREQNAE